MRVDDYIRLHTTLGERHVDHRPLLGANTLLTVPRRELVTNDGCTRDTQGDVDLLELLVTGVASCEDRGVRRRTS